MGAYGPVRTIRRNCVTRCAAWNTISVVGSIFLVSLVAAAIERAQARGAIISVYLDDFVGSHENEDILRKAYTDILEGCVAANFVLNVQKLIEPNKAIVAFNCDLTHGAANVTAERVQRFIARANNSQISFDQYRARVASANSASYE